MKCQMFYFFLFSFQCIIFISCNIHSPHRLQLGNFVKNQKIIFNLFNICCVGDKYTKQFNRVTKTTTCIVSRVVIFWYLWSDPKQEIFQFEKRIEFVCPFHAADFVPPYPNHRTLLKDYIYCCHDQCCNEVHKQIW